MTQGKRYLVLGLVVMGIGFIRTPFERNLSADLKDAGLLPKKLDIKTGEKIGQTFYAVSLGGLRTLVATMFNLRAHNFFAIQKWERVAETFDLMVDLAPRTTMYWDTGCWHQSYNAASYYLYDTKLPGLRRKFAWRDSILYGRDFLERGIRNNPDSAVLRERMGALYADPNKIAAFGNPAEAFEKSYEHYMAAVKTGGARDLAKRMALYSLVRVPGREAEARELLKEIAAEDPNFPPTMLCVQYILLWDADPKQSPQKLIESVFRTNKLAYHCLSNFWMRTNDRFPVYGVALALELLERDLGVKEEESVLKKALLQPTDMETFFSE